MRILLAVAVLGVVACGGGTEPTTDEMTGRWTSAQMDAYFGVTLNLTEHSASDIRGTWTGRHSEQLRQGVVTGTREGQGITLTIQPSAEMGCGYGLIVELERTSSVSATGTAANTTCDGDKGIHTSAVSISRR